MWAADSFAPLVEFWQELLSNPTSLATTIQGHFPLTPTSFAHLKVMYRQLPTRLERAAAYFALNRASFAGFTFCGGFSGSRPWTQESIDRVRDWPKLPLNVQHSDWKATLDVHPSTFTYLDPPYFGIDNYYGFEKKSADSFPHQALATYLSSRPTPWLLSNFDCPEIREMYSGNYMTIPKPWHYGTTHTQSRELLISNYPLENN